MGRALALGALLALVGFLVYLPAWHGGFIWDDDGHVTRLDLRSLHGLWRIWFEVGATQQYYPVLHSAFWIEHRLWGDATLGYHLINVALHVAAGWLLVSLLRRLAVPGAWLAGALFVLHPVAVESVAWISEQKNTLSTVLYLAAMLAYLRFDRQRAWQWYAVSAGLFVLALLSKSVTATLPAALLVTLWWQRGQLSWRRDVAPLAPWLAVGAGAGLFTAWVERTLLGAEGAAYALSAIERGLLAGRAVCFYLGKLFWPADLIFVYPRWSINAASIWQYLFPLAILALAAVAWSIRRRSRGPLAVLLLYVGSLFPALGFLNVYPFIYSFVADHFQYLASMAVFAAVAAGAVRWENSVSRPLLWAGRALGLGVLVTLGVLTWRQCGIYRDAETLYRTTFARNPSCWMAHNNLGVLLTGQGRRDEAIAQYEQTLRLKPDHATAHSNLAIELSMIPGRLPEALDHSEQAVRLKPESPVLHYNLAIQLARVPARRPEAIAQFEAALHLKPDFAEAHCDFATLLTQTPGRLAAAKAHYEEALRLKPDYAEAHNNLAVILFNEGRTTEAIDHYQQALHDKPDYAEAHHRLAVLLAKLPGRLAEAAIHYEEALRLEPASAEIHFNFAHALERMPGRLPDAIAHYEAALRLNPNFAEAHNNLATVLTRIPGRQPEAVAHFEEAIRLKPDYAEAHNNLAVVFFNEGRTAEAIEHLQTALRLKPDYRDARQNLERIQATPNK
jgi:protein O-mannosyl-transferase